MMNDQFKSGSWNELCADATYIRELVFIQEQHIPADEEWDEWDLSSIHFVVYRNSQPVATARLTDNNRIGRVAVLKQYRGAGMGFKLIQQIIELARHQQRPCLTLSAQCYATRFYEKLGFCVQGESYLDCGIPHINMHMQLDKSEK